MVDLYFPRQFSGLSFGEKEFREVCNPFSDPVGTSHDHRHRRDELRVIERILDSEMPLKAKCLALWHLIHGMPHFYFETEFTADPVGMEWPNEFVIVSKYATTGKHWTDAQNQDADRELELDLAASGCSIKRVTGFSEETYHVEPGWAAEMPWPAGCDLGLEYRQDAICVVRADLLFVSFCDDRRGLVPVGPFRDRLTSRIQSRTP